MSTKEIAEDPPDTSGLAPGAFALVFVALALSMFGFYELRLPGFIHHRLHGAHQRLRGGAALGCSRRSQ